MEILGLLLRQPGEQYQQDYTQEVTAAPAATHRRESHPRRVLYSMPQQVAVVAVDQVIVAVRAVRQAAMCHHRLPVAHSARAELQATMAGMVTLPQRMPHSAAVVVVGAAREQQARGVWAVTVEYTAVAAAVAVAELLSEVRAVMARMGSLL